MENPVYRFANGVMEKATTWVKAELAELEAELVRAEKAVDSAVEHRDKVQAVVDSVKAATPPPAVPASAEQPQAPSF